MNENIIMISMAILLCLVGLAKSTRKAPRFERPERTQTDGVNIHWFSLKVGDELRVNVTEIVVAYAADLVEAGYRVPKRFEESGLTGMILRVAEAVDGPYPWTECLVTQGTLFDGILDLAYNGMDLGSVAFGPETLAKTGDADKWVFETEPMLHLTHVKTGNGNRSAYRVACPGFEERTQHTLTEFENGEGGAA